MEQERNVQQCPTTMFYILIIRISDKKISSHQKALS